MSDAVILEILDRILQFATVTIAAILLYKQNKAAKDVKGIKEEVVLVKEKVEVVHDNVNSKTDKQMKMIRALAKAEQKVEDAINGKHKIEPDKKTVPVKRKK